MKSKSKSNKNPIKLLGSMGETTPSMGTIRFLVRAGDVNMMVEFYVLDFLLPFNIILERPRIHRMRVVPSTYYKMRTFSYSSQNPEDKEQSRGLSDMLYEQSQDVHEKSKISQKKAKLTDNKSSEGTGKENIGDQ